LDVSPTTLRARASTIRRRLMQRSTSCSLSVTAWNGAMRKTVKKTGWESLIDAFSPGSSCGVNENFVSGEFHDLTRIAHADETRSSHSHRGFSPVHMPPKNLTPQAFRG